jgi:hypothetical protein
MTNTQLNLEASAVNVPDDTFVEPEVPDTEFLEEDQSDSDSDASSSDDDQDMVQIDENTRSYLEKFKK